MMKTCTNCGIDKQHEEFSKNKKTRDGLASWCRSCCRVASNKWKEANKQVLKERRRVYLTKNKDAVNAYNSHKKHNKRNRTPSWADLDNIKMFYEVASVLSRSGVLFEVDHVVPLHGKTVSGLHVEENLQVIPAWQNRKKRNKFEEV